jgi:hypothetical protein
MLLLATNLVSSSVCSSLDNCWLQHEQAAVSLQSGLVAQLGHGGGGNGRTLAGRRRAKITGNSAAVRGASHSGGGKLIAPEGGKGAFIFHWKGGES